VVWVGEYVLVAAVDIDGTVTTQDLRMAERLLFFDQKLINPLREDK